MKQGFTRIVMLVDRSGSMASVQDATVSGINEFITAQKSQPGNAVLKIVQFDENYMRLTYDTILDAPLTNITGITKDQYTPRGMTPLNDAIGKTIDELGAELRNLSESERPEKVIVCIVTDGHENASHKFTKPQIKQMIEHQRTKYNWVFSYIGANVDAITEAQQYGIPTGSAMQFTADDRHIRAAFVGVSNYVGAVRSANLGKENAVYYDKADRSNSVDANDPHANNAEVPTRK